MRACPAANFVQKANESEKVSFSREEKELMYIYVRPGFLIIIIMIIIIPNIAD